LITKLSAPITFPLEFKVPTLALLVTVRLANVPTLVIFGCAFVVIVPALVAVPAKLAVIVPALKLPDASRETIAFAVFALVAVDPKVIAPVDALAVIPPPLPKLNTPLLVIVTAVPPLKLVPPKPEPIVNGCTVFEVIVPEPPNATVCPLNVTLALANLACASVPELILLAFNELNPLPLPENTPVLAVKAAAVTVLANKLALVSRTAIVFAVAVILVSYPST